MFAQYLDVPAFLADSKILQVVEGTSTTSKAITATSFPTLPSTTNDSNLSVTITPTSTANRILVLVSQSVSVSHSATTAAGGKVALVQTINSSPTAVSTFIYSGGTKDLALSGASGNLLLTVPWTFFYLTSAIATLNSVTYKTQGAVNPNGSTITFQPDSQRSSILAIEVKG